MDYKMFIADDFFSYGDSLLYPSGSTEIASISCTTKDGDDLWVSLRVQGHLCIKYKGEIYKDCSQYSQELIDHIESGDYVDLINSGEMELRENNWWEWCFSDGDGYVSDAFPRDYKDLGEVAHDLMFYMEELIQTHEL